MKNSDFPAMPLSGDAYQDFAGYDGTKNTGYNPECQGLTKREMFALHAPKCPDWYDSNQDDQIRYIKWPAFYADCVLEELSK